MFRADRFKSLVSLFLPASLIFFLAAGCAKSDGAPEAPKAVVYGAEFVDAGVMSVSEFYAKLDELEGKRVQVKGTVTGVCENRGCWIDIGEDLHPKTVKFKVQDGVMVFPLDAKGKNVVAEGTVVRRQLTMEKTITYLKHQAEEKQEEFDPSTVKEAMTLVMLKGRGARISDSR